MGQEQREINYKKWLLDLAAREAQWMESHPEGISKSIDDVLAKLSVNTVARVEESRTMPGSWNLYVDDKLIEIFYPPDAQMKATARLGRILNE